MSAATHFLVLPGGGYADHVGHEAEPIVDWLAGLLPDARLTIYPDSAHGFLFQHHTAFAADVNAFLAEGVAA